jgi:hypothetical protein
VVVVVVVHEWRIKVLLLWDVVPMQLWLVVQQEARTNAEVEPLLRALRLAIASRWYPAIATLQ